MTDPRNRSDVLDQVRSGDADLGVVEGAALTGAPSPGSLCSQPLGQHELVAVLPPATRPAPPSVTVADVIGHGLISTPPGTAVRTLLDEQLAAAGLPGEITVETAHVASVVPLVLARAGATILPRGMAARAAAQGARVAALDPPARVELSLVWRADRLSRLGSDLVLLAAEARDRSAGLRRGDRVASPPQSVSGAIVATGSPRATAPAVQRTPEG